MAIGERHYIMEKGRIVWNGNTKELQARPELKSRYLGVDC
jgi:branched-chain amino acid transport system ATP-binding protein